MTIPPSSTESIEVIEQKVREEFIANVNHDLRTPLNAVIGFAQLIESEMFGKIDNPQYLEYVRHIQESGYELLSRIEDLFGMADLGTASPDETFERLAPRKKQLAAVE